MCFLKLFRPNFYQYRPKITVMSKKTTGSVKTKFFFSPNFTLINWGYLIFFSKMSYLSFFFKVLHDVLFRTFIDLHERSRLAFVHYRSLSFIIVHDRSLSFTIVHYRSLSFTIVHYRSFLYVFKNKRFHLLIQVLLKFIIKNILRV